MKYPNETQARRNPFRPPFTIGSARVKALRLFIRHTFGATLPDDDYGRMVLRPLLDHIAFNGGDAKVLQQVCLDLLPELDDDDSMDMLIKEVRPGIGRKWNADALAREIALDFETRTLLGIRIIGSWDANKDRRKAIYAQKRAADKRWAREKGGAKPHAKSARRRQPWEAEGVSKRTYYRHRKQAADAHKVGDDAPHKISGWHHFGPHTLSISHEAVATAGAATPPMPNQKAACQGDDVAREGPEIDTGIAASTKKQNFLSFEATTSKSDLSTTRAETFRDHQKEKIARATFFARRRKWERDRDAAREQCARDRDAGRGLNGVAQAVIADQRQRRRAREDIEWREREAKSARIREKNERRERNWLIRVQQGDPLALERQARMNMTRGERAAAAGASTW